MTQIDACYVYHYIESCRHGFSVVMQPWALACSLTVNMQALNVIFKLV